MKAISVVLTGLLVLGASAHGAILYSQPPEASGGSRSSSTLNFLGGTPGFQTYDDFTLAASGTVSAVNWWGSADTSGANAFTITFFAGGATPGAQLATFSVAPTITAGTPIIAYSATLSTPFDALGGTQYWISVFNGAPDARWAWTHTTDPGTSLQRRLDTNTFNSTFGVAFSLEDTAVPEPSAILLMGVGVALLLFRRGAA